MEREEWRHLALRLAALGGPLLFLTLPVPALSGLDLFAGGMSYLYLALVGAVVAAFFSASEWLLARCYFRAFFTALGPACLVFLGSLLLQSLFGRILASNLFTPLSTGARGDPFVELVAGSATGLFNYRLAFLALWGALPGLAAGLCWLDVACAARLGAAGFGSLTLFGFLFLYFPSPSPLFSLWFLVIPLFLALAFVDEWHKPAWLLEGCDPFPATLWILRGSENLVGGDPLALVPLEGPGVGRVLIKREGECYYLENGTPGQAVTLDRTRVDGRLALRNGQRFDFSNHTFTFREKRERIGDSFPVPEALPVEKPYV